GLQYEKCRHGHDRRQNRPKCSCPGESACCRLGRSPLGEAAVQGGADRSRRFRAANRRRPRPLLCCLRARSGNGLHRGRAPGDTKGAGQFARTVGEAEDAYMPSYPPMSPVTTSHFAMWSLFDVQFGQSRETVGTCFLRIAELTEMPAELRATVAALQASRLGIYMHCGHEGRFVRLREIGTETAILCLVPAGYRGDLGEVWLARLLPPATAL